MNRKLYQALAAAACLLALAGCSKSGKPEAVKQPPSVSADSSQPATASAAAAGKVIVKRLPTKSGSLTALAVEGADNLWVAQGNAVSASTDGGAHWSRLGDLTGSAVQLDFVTAQQGWAVTAQGLFATVDGGKSWKAKTTAFTVQQVDFVSATLGWAADAQGKLFTTGDGGGSWTGLSSPCQPNWSLSLSFVDAKTGYAMCSGQPGAGQQAKQLYRTPDGGKSWQLVADSNPGVPGRLPGSGYAALVQFTSTNTGVLAGSRSDLLVTADGGKTWQGVGLDPESAGVTQVAFANPRQGFILARGALMRTDDGGVSWKQVYPGVAPQDMADLQTPAPDVWFGFGTVTNPGAILKSTDRGATWTQVGSIGGGENVMGLSFPDATHGWALTSRFSATGSEMRTLFRTQDGGATWTKVTQAPADLKELFATISFVDAQTGFIASGWGHLSMTTDGGKTLTAIDRTDSQSTNFRFFTSQAGWKLEDFALKATADGGKTWQPLGLNARVIGFDRAGAGRAWAVVAELKGTTYENALYTSTDDGKTWSQVDLGDLHPAAIHFADAQNGLLVSVDQELFATRDGGQSWTQVR